MVLGDDNDDDCPVCNAVNSSVHSMFMGGGQWLGNLNKRTRVSNVQFLLGPLTSWSSGGREGKNSADILFQSLLWLKTSEEGG